MANISHAVATPGWKPQHRLRDTLPAMAELLKRDPVGFYEENRLPLPADIAAE